CCDYENNPSNSQIYGKLYNWYAATDERKMCPTGWHVPNVVEWYELIDYLGGEFVAGGKLKEVGTLHWKSPNNSATNESGFTALPGGYRNDAGVFNGIGNRGSFWSSTENGYYAWGRSLGYSNGYCLGMNDVFSKENGFSVRCIKD
ncbi:MAG TPA: fibrobacter succinogenes major paralogous domain-containing protein, partial [Tenuifilaceae bacterium]|nr:fibrobacter succinogenes major paralogous domain-containing protein [Tenuifilaceae bacterium]